MRLGVVVSLIVIACSGAIAKPAQSKTLLQGIEQNLNGIERQLCSKFPSKKCKQAKSKNKTKQMRPPKLKAKIAAPVVEPSAVPPVQRAKPPMPKLRPADLNSGPHVQAPTPLAAKAPPPVVALPIVPIAPPPAGDQGSACLAALAATGASFTPVAQPSTSSACNIDNPVRLNSFSTKPAVVKLPDQPTVSCTYALKLSQFVDQRLQPLALQSGSAVVSFGTGPGFDCRGRNGDSSKRMSEHANGDAVDIVYLKLANKTQILVKDALNVQSPNFAFLRDLRALACIDFMTVLGPGANAAHAEHFHIDLEVRKGGYRICE